MRSGVDIKTIQNIYQDPHTNITLEILARLAQVIKVDVSKLIESEPKTEA